RRRLTERIALGLLDRMGDGPRLDAAQRSWLLQDFLEDLDCQIEDAEERGITERGVSELIATGAIVEWLEAGDPPPVEAVELLEKAVAKIPPRPSDGERWRRDAYLAAIAELGGAEEAPAKLWRGGGDERTRVLLDFQGRKVRGRMEKVGLTIGELAERSGIDTLRLVAILFGKEEMGALEWLDLSEALGVPLAWMLEGIHVAPRAGPEARGFRELGPGQGDSATRSSDTEGGDPR
ncbi:MAG TPA: helix-turn-helix transcriptional regulator, partial [Solirubrobacterales bacterium]